MPNILKYGWPGTYYLGKEEEDAVASVLKSKSLFRYYGHDLQGYVDKLEQQYAKRTQQKHAIAVNSCTNALYMSIVALGLGPGDEVLVPGFMWVSCIGAIVRAGCIPRLVEIDDSFTVDPEDMERKITGRTRAALVVHMSGAPADMDAVMEIARRRGLFVIEDFAQSNGGSYKGRPLGSFGDVSVTSFQYNKNATSGEGGIVCCSNPNVYQRVYALHDLGYGRNTSGILDTAAAEISLWGIGSRMSEITAAIIYEQTKKLDGAVQAMNAASRHIYDALGDVRGLRTRRQIDPAGDSGPSVILIWPDADVCREVVEATRKRGVTAGSKSPGNIPISAFGLHLYYNVTSLKWKKGVDAKGYPWTHPDNQFAADYAYEIGSLPISDDLFSRASMISITPAMTEEDCVQIAQIVRSVAEEIIGQ